MKELKIHVKIGEENVATAVQRKGFDNSASTNLEIIGILQNLIRIEQDKMQTQAKVKLPKDFNNNFNKDRTQIFDIDDKENKKMDGDL